MDIKGTPMQMKSINKKRVLQCIQEHAPISRAEISAKLSISKPTVSILVDELIQEHWVVEKGNGEASSQGGRRPIQLYFDEQAAYVAGIDIGGTKVKMVISDLSGTIVSQCHFPTNQYLEQGLIIQIRDKLNHLVKHAGIKQEAILGMGVGVPGITDTVNGLIVDAPSLNWMNYPFISEAKKYFSFPIHIDNDVNVAVLGEQWLGRAKNKRNVLFISVGTGIGCGIIIDNQLYRGTTNAAGEMGYMVTNKNDMRQNFHPLFQRYGYLESVAGGKSIGKQLTMKLQKNREHPLFKKATETELSAKDAFFLAKSGDLLAQQVIDEAIEHLGFGIVNAACLLNPEVIILGGGVSKSAEEILFHVRKLVDQYLPSSVDIYPSQLADNAGVLGAVSLFLREHESIIRHS
ncbi:ROK family transcriptional regulator [Heyndrickxia oleronia]|uniref:ROK family transcriptional regulator n=1 Tax=Heyndrickxia oleronia TaxID=38875 RepID=UPI003750619F